MLTINIVSGDELSRSHKLVQEKHTNNKADGGINVIRYQVMVITPELWVEKIPWRRKSFISSLKNKDPENGGEGLG